MQMDAEMMKQNIAENKEKIFISDKLKKYINNKSAYNMKNISFTKMIMEIDRSFMKIIFMKHL
ncbi:MAG: hypothetical protein QXW79_02560 [Thermoplasmata archaeon]